MQVLVSLASPKFCLSNLTATAFALNSIILAENNPKTSTQSFNQIIPAIFQEMSLDHSHHTNLQDPSDAITPKTDSCQKLTKTILSHSS